MPAPFTNVLISIRSANDAVGYAFSRMLTRHLGAIRGRECTTVVMSAKPLGGQDVTHCCPEDWSNDNPLFHLDRLRHHAPVNSVILTSQALAGLYQRANLSAFDNYTADAGIDVIYMTNYGDERERTQFTRHFGAVDTKHVVRLRTLLLLMIDDIRSGEIESPPGHSPEIFLHPEMTSLDDTRQGLGVLATFPPWMRRQAVEVLGEIQPAFLYTPNEKAIPPDGPIPLVLQLARHDGYR
ncbi:MAG: hypothetical protein K8T26_11490 [Lentisphaerae bacterium]|nr:hypothetical protein [Lentisphaerota bacterium]